MGRDGFDGFDGFGGFDASIDRMSSMDHVAPLAPMASMAAMEWCCRMVQEVKWLRSRASKETEKSLGTSLRTMTAPRVSDGSRSLRRVDTIAATRADGFSYKSGEERAEGLPYKIEEERAEGLPKKMMENMLQD